MCVVNQGASADVRRDLLAHEGASQHPTHCRPVHQEPPTQGRCVKAEMPAAVFACEVADTLAEEAAARARVEDGDAGRLRCLDSTAARVLRRLAVVAEHIRENTVRPRR